MVLSENSRAASDEKSFELKKGDTRVSFIPAANQHMYSKSGVLSGVNISD